MALKNTPAPVVKAGDTVAYTQPFSAEVIEATVVRACVEKGLYYRLALDNGSTLTYGRKQRVAVVKFA